MPDPLLNRSAGDVELFVPLPRDNWRCLWWCNISKPSIVVLPHYQNVMFGVGLDEIQETEQTQPSPPIFVFARVVKPQL